MPVDLSANAAAYQLLREAENNLSNGMEQFVQTK